MSQHIVKPRTYLIIFAVLIALTCLTVAVRFLPLEGAHLWIGLLISVIKATLVVLFFMHVYYSDKLIWAVAISGILFLIILIVFTMNDYLTRGWLSSP